MRNITFFLLFATVAAPALAAPDEDRRGRHRSADTPEQSESRRLRADRVETRHSPGSADRPSIALDDRHGSRSGHSSGRSHGGRHSSSQQSGSHGAGGQAGHNDSSHSGGSAGNHGSGSHSGGSIVRHGSGSHSGGSVVGHSGGSHSGGSVVGHGGGSHQQWSRNWRNDHRYDWQSYRNSHRSLYNLGRYYDPFGRNYRRLNIGFNLGQGYYGSRYWLNDPWQYRLPPAYGPYRWVRYWNDALLVNIYTGEVVDVMHGFFW